MKGNEVMPYPVISTDSHVIEPAGIAPERRDDKRPYCEVHRGARDPLAKTAMRGTNATIDRHDRA